MTRKCKELNSDLYWEATVEAYLSIRYMKGSEESLTQQQQSRDTVETLVYSDSAEQLLKVFRDFLHFKPIYDWIKERLKHYYL